MSVSRTPLYVAFGVAAVILLGWRLVWLEGAREMRRQVAAFAEAQAEAGASVSHDGVRTRGFPFYLRGVVDNFSFTSADGRYGYRADKVFIDALPYALDRIVFSAWGAQGVVVNGAPHDFTAAGGRLSVGADATRGWIIRAQADALTMAGDFIAAQAGPSILNIAPAPDAPHILEVSLVADLVDATGAGATADRIELFIAADTRDFSADIRKAHLALGEARIDAAGALGVDANGRLEGALDARLARPVEIARQVATAMRLPPGDAEALEGAIALAALSAGGQIRIDFRDGDAFFAGVRVGDAPSTGIQP